jgi:hypothetical protein
MELENKRIWDSNLNCGSTLAAFLRKHMEDKSRLQQCAVFDKYAVKLRRNVTVSDDVTWSRCNLCTNGLPCGQTDRTTYRNTRVRTCKPIAVCVRAQSAHCHDYGDPSLCNHGTGWSSECIKLLRHTAKGFSSSLCTGGGGGGIGVVFYPLWWKRDILTWAFFLLPRQPFEMFKGNKFVRSFVRSFVVLPSPSYLFTVGVEGLYFTWSHWDTHHSR